MSSRQRMEMALNFQEADRVPIEIALTPTVREHPKAAKLIDLVDAHSDRFSCFRADTTLMGANGEMTTEVIEEARESTSTLCRFSTINGEFTAIRVVDNFNPSYYHWGKFFIETLEDLERFSECDFTQKAVPDGFIANIEANCGRERTPGISMYHPFGNMARLCRLEEFYSWLLLEPDLIHKVFEKQYRQLDALITRIKAPYMYSFASFEMALPPWMGRDAFDEFIYHYDLKMNKRIHEFGGKVRHHCHDKMFDYLVYWADMGVDSIEPLEMPPAGDTDLAEAKKLIGDRMSLAGNIPSQRFGTLSPDEIDHLVQNAIRDAAAGGGFILRCASLVAGLNSCRNEEQFAKWIPSVECFIESGLKHGGY